MPWCADGCPEEIASSPGVIDCPYCGADLMEFQLGLSSQPTLDALELEDEDSPESILAEGLDAQVWGPDGIDPIDERAFLDALPILGRVGPKEIDGALARISGRVPQEGARRLLERHAAPPPWPAAPRVQLLVDAPEAAHLYPLRVLVQAEGANRIGVEVHLPGVDSVQPNGPSEKPAPRGKTGISFAVRTAAGAHVATGHVQLTIRSRGAPGLRVYRAPFRYEVSGTRHTVTRYEIHNEGVLRWNQHLADVAVGGSAPGGDTDVQNSGKLDAELVAGGDLRVRNDGLARIRQRVSEGGAKAGARAAALPEHLFVVPDLASTASSTLQTSLRSRTGKSAWLEPSGAPAHGAVFVWRDRADKLHGAVIVAEEEAALGRHHRLADLPIRSRNWAANGTISRRAAVIRWVGNSPRLHRTGQSEVLVDGEPLPADGQGFAQLRTAGHEVTWLRKPGLRWEVRVLEGAVERLPVRWHEPAPGGVPCLYHVVAPKGGWLGGAPRESLLPLPAGGNSATGAALVRSANAWWLRGVAVPGEEGQAGRQARLLIDGRPCRHPELRYGLRDGARVRLPCGSELEYHVGRSTGPPDGDWEIRARISEGGPLAYLRVLLGHVVHE